MTIEIEEVTVKDGIVRITALNCSEENLQKLERLRDDCYQKELQFVFDTRNNKSDCIYLTYWLHHQKVTAGCKTYSCISRLFLLYKLLFTAHESVERRSL